MSAYLHGFISCLVWDGPLRPRRGFWLGLQPNFLLTSWKHERHRQNTFLVSYLLYMSLSTVWLVYFTIANWPPRDAYRTAVIITKLVFYLLRLSCLFFVSSSSKIQFRHGIYLFIFVLFGCGPLFKAWADPVSHHVLHVIGRRLLCLYVNAFFQWILFDAISIPIVMLNLQGLILYVGRCLVYLVSEDSAVEEIRLKTFMLHSNIGVALSVFSACCALIVHFIFFRIHHRSPVHPGKPVTIGKQFVPADIIPVVPSAIDAPSLDGPDQDQEHVIVSDAVTHFELGAHLVEDSCEHGGKNLHFPQPAGMLPKDEQQEMDETLPGEPLPPPDVVADPSALLSPPTVPASPVPIQYDSEGTVVSAISSTAARVVQAFNRSCLLGALCALEAVQDVSSEVGSLVTSLDSMHSRPAAVGDRALPHPHETMEFQGAWEEFGGAPMDDWLRTFVISGRTYLSGDGSEGFLLKRLDDQAILLEGGILQIQPNGNLARVGKSGRTFLFRRISVASPSDVIRFQGFWISQEIELLIESIVWNIDGRRSGLVKIEHGNTMLSRQIMSITRMGNLCLLSPSGNQRFFEFACSIEELDRHGYRIQQG